MAFSLPSPFVDDYTRRTVFLVERIHYASHSMFTISITSLLFLILVFHPCFQANSKYMREILQRMNRDMFEFITFGNDCIFQRDVSEWPICDVLIAFHSSGFPLEKVQEYVDLRHPYSINDLCIQDQMKVCVYSRMRRDSG